MDFNEIYKKSQKLDENVIDWIKGGTLFQKNRYEDVENTKSALLNLKQVLISEPAYKTDEVFKSKVDGKVAEIEKSIKQLSNISIAFQQDKPVQEPTEDIDETPPTSEDTEEVNNNSDPEVENEESNPPEEDPPVDEIPYDEEDNSSE